LDIVVRHAGVPAGASGGKIDAVTGCVHFRYRELNTNQMRWIQQDPAQYVHGLNICQYTRSRPTVMLDPNGRGSIPPLDPDGFGPDDFDLMGTGDDLINEALGKTGQYIDPNGVLRSIGDDVINDALKNSGQTMGTDGLLKPISPPPSVGTQLLSGAVLLTAAALAIKGTAEAVDINTMMTEEAERLQNLDRKTVRLLNEMRQRQALEQRIEEEINKGPICDNGVATA